MSKHAFNIKWLSRLFGDEGGPTAVEYAVMLALIIVFAVGAISRVGRESSSTFDSASSTLDGTYSGKLDGNVDGNGQI
jgi:pilus assembly protein Flp/PilA